MKNFSGRVLGMMAGCLVVAGCSSSNNTVSYGLAPEADQAPARSYARRSAKINYYRPGASYSNAMAPPLSQIAPSPTYPGRSVASRPYALQSGPRLLSPPHSQQLPPSVRPRNVAPLRRFAAMPRHRPHAPHVRQHEPSCLSSGVVQKTRFIRPRGSIGGGQCYISKPFVMYAAARGGVRFKPAATVRCQMVPSVETWVQDVLRPAARRYLGSDIVELRIAASYACRTRNHKAGAKLSEHGRANAIDISKFHLADGRVVTVKKGWRGPEAERRFLRYIHRGACEHFSTVLGPNADRYHHDHFHFDLASHGRRGTYRVCK